MSSFKFNFSSTDNNLNSKIENNKETNLQIGHVEAEEIMPDKQLKDFESFITHARMFTCGDLEIGHVESSAVIDRLKDKFTNSVNDADKVQSDLIPGIYEGGLKIWECTSDLISYLIQNEDNIAISNKNVLDLGCGAGILGIYALLNGSTVTFQDYAREEKKYLAFLILFSEMLKNALIIPGTSKEIVVFQNKEIVEYVTIPNVLLNLEEDEQATLINNCKFFSGDWSSFAEKLPAQTYDLILTSETIYNDTNYDKIINLLTKLLKPDGTVYAAAKTHYFGVGGGTRIFESALQKNGSLQSEVCWKSLGGIQREILSIKHKNV